MGILDSIATGGLSTIVSTALEIANKFIEDPNKKMEAQIQILQMTQTSEFKQMDGILQEQSGQVDLNKVEAASESIFKSGWRPAVGWVCAAAFGLQTIIFPIASWVAELYQKTLTVPALPTELLYTTLFGMLGIGGMRTFEKMKGK